MHDQPPPLPPMDSTDPIPLPSPAAPQSLIPCSQTPAPGRYLVHPAPLSLQLGSPPCPLLLAQTQPAQQDPAYSGAVLSVLIYREARRAMPRPRPGLSHVGVCKGPGEASVHPPRPQADIWPYRKEPAGWTHGHWGRQGSAMSTLWLVSFGAGVHASRCHIAQSGSLLWTSPMPFSCSEVLGGAGNPSCPSLPFARVYFLPSSS